jgi:Flp pilus assembly protein TadD
VTLRLQGKLDESVAALQRSIDRNPNFIYAYRELATTLRQQGKSKEAAAVSSKADTIEADNLKTRMGL